MSNTFDDHLKRNEGLRDIFKEDEIKSKYEQYFDDWINDEANGMKEAISFMKEDIVQILEDFDAEFNSKKPSPDVSKERERIMSEVSRMKLLLDYNKFLKECVSLGVEINKDTIRDYLKGSYYHEPINS